MMPASSPMVMLEGLGLPCRKDSRREAPAAAERAAMEVMITDLKNIL